MSISNFGELKSAVGTWLNRADLTSYIPDFVTLAASRIYYGSDDQILPSKAVRTWSMQNEETPTVTNGTIALPARWLSTILLRGETWTIEYSPPSMFEHRKTTGGAASFYTILNNTIQLSSPTAQTITHDFYAAFAPFSSDSDTNALLTSAPNLWLWATLLEANIFISADDEAKKCHRLYNSIATGLTNNLREMPGGSLAVSVR